MKDEPRKPLEALGDEALEARIVAWVLGEASAFEVAELEERCASDPDLKRFAERMREMHQLIEADGKPVNGDEWKLPEAKRRKVVDLLGVEPVVRLEKRSFINRRVIRSLAACLLATLIALPVFVKQSPVVGESKSIVSYMAESAPADIAVNREFDYLTEYQPPELPNRDEARTFAIRGVSPEAPSSSMSSARGVDLNAVVEADPFSAAPSVAGDSMDSSDLGMPHQAEAKPPAPSAKPTPTTAPARPSTPAVLAANVAGPEGIDDFSTMRDGRIVEDVRYSRDREARVAEALGSRPELQAKRDSSMTSNFAKESKSESLARTGIPELGEVPGIGRLFFDGGSTSGGVAGGGSDVNGAYWMSGGTFANDYLNGPASNELNARAGGSVVGVDDRSNHRGDKGEEGRVPYGGFANSDRMTFEEYQEARRFNLIDALTGDDGALVNEAIAPATKTYTGFDFVERASQFGRENEARELLEKAPVFYAQNRYAGQSLAQLDDPIRSNLAADGDHAKNGDAIRRDLYSAEGAYNLGKFDQAKEEYDEVIRKDPYNTAARRGLERVNAAKSDYYRAAYDQSRAELLTQVDAAWDLAVPSDDPVPAETPGGDLEGEVHAGYGNSYEFRFIDKDAELLAESDEAKDSGEDSLAAAEERLDRLKGKVSGSDDSSVGMSGGALREESSKQFANRESGRRGQLFDDAKADFETNQRLLEQLKIKLVGEEMQRRITENPVIVHQEPADPRAPGMLSFDRRWESKSTVQVRPQVAAMEVPLASVSRNRGEVQPGKDQVTEAAYSENNLDQVITELGLVSKLGRDRETLIQDLKKGIEVEGVDGTDLVEVRFKHKDKQIAKSVSESLLQKVGESAAESAVERSSMALDELRDAVEKQEAAVEEKRKALTSTIRNQSLVYQGLSGAGREGGFTGEEASEMVARSYAQLSESKLSLESQIETLLRFDGDQLMTYASGLDLPENIIRTLHPQYLEARRELDSLKLSGLGDDHPAVGRQREIVEGMKADLDEGVVALRETLRAQLELSNEQLARLTQELERNASSVASGETVLVQDSLGGEKDHSATLDAMAEVSAADEAYSTFSMHVSDASFKLAAAAIERGEVPAAESVRPEEFYNAFDYGDPAPTANEPVACAVEQCAHPAFPQRNLLRIAVRTGAEGRAQSVPLNLTLLLDNSGSMEREDRAQGLNQAVAGLSSLLKEGDTVTVAGFSRQPRLLADRVDGKDGVTLNGLVSQTPAEGGTNLEEALKLGGNLAKRQFKEGAQNRVVLFTDGAANLGDADPESLNGQVEQLRNQGIAFDAAGFGADGLNDRLLERLTRNGNGRYYVVDDAEDADEGFAKQLAGAFRPAAENVKVQVIFNPSRVGNYKLIGFEEHRLKKEDFRNDAVDAAEMASEEAGVALYQFEVLPEGQGEVGEVSVRFRDTSSGEMVEQSWPIPYDPQTPSFDTAKPGIQLAGIAAFVAEKLRGAPLAEAVDYSQLRGVMGRVKAEYDGNERVTQLETMMRR